MSMHFFGFYARQLWTHAFQLCSCTAQLSGCFSNSSGHLLKVNGKTEALLCVDTLLPLGTGGPLKPESRCCMRSYYLHTGT